MFLSSNVSSKSVFKAAYVETIIKEPYLGMMVTNAQCVPVKRYVYIRFLFFMTTSADYGLDGKLDGRKSVNSPLLLQCVSCISTMSILLLIM